ncbi:Aste57867_11114 [Aphanomyces stellatus]|uniref:Dynactin subunit 4 n=1 Tax=Aphanomyces stellatus TaxID=120398 RepID=A0A485KSS1_9STRA|nr:hypothetical protein As57867_011072 [Aphanomyces stellatus]VFT87981.1 Aste57867_11114 [Aphanomyces stellatus]
MSVKYLCGCGRPYPLSELYWSDTCKKIVCPWPTCSLQEIDSYFCRFQMDNLPSKEAGAYKNRSARTFACPDCKSTLQTLKHDEKYLFFCAHCRWDSEAMLTDEDPDTLMMVANARERDEHVFDVLLAHYQQKSQAASNQLLASKRASAHSSSSRYLKPLLPMRHTAPPQLGWKMEHLEAKLRATAATAVTGIDAALQKKCDDKFPSHVVFDDRTDDAAACAAESDMSKVSTLAQRNLCTPLLQTRDVGALFPSRPDLRVKRSWRCVESMANGQPGILIKPQINPMTGDSSMVVAASWWKKATLAIHYLPTITIQRRWDAHGVAWLLVENPMEEDIALVVVSQGGRVPAPMPIRVGAYEDPNLSDTSGQEIQDFIDMKDAGTRPVLASRNYIKMKVEASGIATDDSAVELAIQMYEATSGESMDVQAMPLLCSFAVALEIPRHA